MPVSSTYRADAVYPSIGEGFYDPVDAAAFPKLETRYRNQRWADRVGLGSLTSEEWLKYFGRFEALPQNMSAPLAMRYHGHQFQNYNPEIGDGRGFLYAQLRDADDHRLLDLATKGSGQTPFSRFGDGRLTLKGGVREVLVTALLEALGVYTSKSFSLIETGEQLYRNDEPSPTRSSVLVRLGHSHIRFGTFQRHAFEQNAERLQALVDYSVAHYYPDLASLDRTEKIGAFLRSVCEASAGLVAQWMAAGFVHGVLNTDNMNITGESFDYGPYRLLPTYQPGFVAAYFDQTGLYAFGKQPEVVLWNLKQLAGALHLICNKDTLVEALNAYGPAYEAAVRRSMLGRLGLELKNADEDVALLQSLTKFLFESQVGFEQFFFDWFGGQVSEPRAMQSPEAAKYAGGYFDDLKMRLDGYSSKAAAKLDAPYFGAKQPCTLLIDEIEAIWDRIAEHDDWAVFEDKLAQIEQMRQALQD